MSFVGIDALLLKQEVKSILGNHHRKGLIGVGVQVSDLDVFKKNYEASFAGLMEKHGVENLKPIYCARDLIELFEFDDISTEIKVLEEIRDQNIDFVEKIHFFYTYIFGLQEISVFGATPQYKKIPLFSNKADVQDFYDLIQSSYPMHCAWKLQNDGSNDKIFTDNFQGRLSPSWMLIMHDNLKVLYHGDKCNHLVSMADILVRLMKLKMYPNNKCFLKEDIEKICKSEFKGKAKMHFLGRKYLKQICPNETKRIIAHKLMQHPIYFIAKEKPNDEAEQTMVEDSPRFNKMLKQILNTRGCFKYYEKGHDERVMKNGDKFIYFGENGQDHFKKLVKLGYKISEFK